MQISPIARAGSTFPVPSMIFTCTPGYGRPAASNNSGRAWSAGRKHTAVLPVSVKP
jgi:hypothetical protein